MSSRRRSGRWAGGSRRRAGSSGRGKGRGLGRAVGKNDDDKFKFLKLSYCQNQNKQQILYLTGDNSIPLLLLLQIMQRSPPPRSHKKKQPGDFPPSYISYFHKPRTRTLTLTQQLSLHLKGPHTKNLIYLFYYLVSTPSSPFTFRQTPDFYSSPEAQQHFINTYPQLLFGQEQRNQEAEFKQKVAGIFNKSIYQSYSGMSQQKIDNLRNEERSIEWRLEGMKECIVWGVKLKSLITVKTHPQQQQQPPAFPGVLFWLRTYQHLYTLFLSSLLCYYASSLPPNNPTTTSSSPLRQNFLTHILTKIQMYLHASQQPQIQINREFLLKMFEFESYCMMAEFFGFNRNEMADFVMQANMAKHGLKRRIATLEKELEEKEGEVERLGGMEVGRKEVTDRRQEIQKDLNKMRWDLKELFGGFEEVPEEVMEELVEVKEEEGGEELGLDESEPNKFMWSSPNKQMNEQ